jgi:hypothetical protein
MGNALAAAVVGLTGPLYYKFVGVPLFRRMSRSKNWWVKNVLLFQIGNSYRHCAESESAKPIWDRWRNRG